MTIFGDDNDHEISQGSVYLMLVNADKNICDVCANWYVACDELSKIEKGKED